MSCPPGYPASSHATSKASPKPGASNQPGTMVRAMKRHKAKGGPSKVPTKGPDSANAYMDEVEP